jgi:carboxyl-terminal processing protease
MDRRPDSRLLPLVAILLTVSAFGSGVLLERTGWMPGSHADVGEVFDPFWEAWDLVEEHFVDQSAVQPQKMTHGAIEGMLASLGDTGHTGFLSPAERELLDQSMEGKFDGIGARMTIRKNEPTVAETFANSPARAAGLKPGDILLEVDAKPVAGLPVDKVAALVRGPAGTEVHLRASREGEADVLDFHIQRAKVDIPVVVGSVLPGTKVGYIALREFGGNADAQLKTTLVQVRGQGAQALIFDIRGNPGGLKDQAVAVTSEFLAEGNVFIEQDAKGQRTSISVRSGGSATELPLVVLIDEGSASSSEIFAGALQDHGRAKLVGTKTYGTGTVLQPFDLSDGSAIMLAVSQWFTPKGRQIWHQGIVPDVEAKLAKTTDLLPPEEIAELTVNALAATHDTQLLKALEILRAQR